MASKSLLRPSTVCTSCARRFNTSRLSFRPFSSTTPQKADEPSSKPQPARGPVVQEEIATPPVSGDPAAPTSDTSVSSTTTTTPPPPRRTRLSDIASDPRFAPTSPNSFAPGTEHPVYGLAPAGDPADAGLTQAERIARATYRLHIYAHKHNTHMTLADPARRPMLSVSAGNLGFRKASRGGFDAAYQLAGYMLTTIRERGWLKDIAHVELVFRGYGTGREAATKALLGVEGQVFRGLVTRVTDHTRLKFGGTRSEKPRRLG